MKKIALLTVILGLSVGAHIVVAKSNQEFRVTANKKGVVKIKGDNAVYLVAAKADQQMIDVQMVGGKKARAKFQVNPQQDNTYDVYRVDFLGTIEDLEWKPCIPDDPVESDCTPINWPPGATQPVGQLGAFLRVLYP